MTLQREKEQVKKRKRSSFYKGREANQLISPANYSAHTDDVEQVQHYASVDARKRLQPGVAGERYKPICNVDRALVFQEGLKSTGCGQFIN